MTITAFFIPGEPADGPAGTVLAGSMYVERHDPEGEPAGPPIVLIHGGGGQGTEWITTPDGRPGWAQLLVAEGRTVYVVDRPAHGRSPYHPSMGPMGPIPGDRGLTPLFTPPALGPGAHPTAYRHTQWAGGKEIGDIVFDQVLAWCGALLADRAVAQRLEQARLADLLDQIGPAVIIACSNGGPGAWLAADARPGKVLGFVSVETAGPPFTDEPELGLSLPWGITTAPLTYEPRIDSPEQLKVAPAPPPELTPVPYLLPSIEYRLPNLAQFPIAVVTGEASVFRMFDKQLVAFLERGGCEVHLKRLEDLGIHGNGHGMIFEKNNGEVLAVVTEWIDKHATSADR